MKIFCVVFIIITSFFIGKCVQNKYKKEYDFLVYLKNFATFLYSNLTIFKTDIVSVIDNFVELQNGEMEKFNKIFKKENGIYLINNDEVKIFNSRENDFMVITSFFSSIGKNNYELEKQKVSSFLDYIEKISDSYYGEIKSKGELTKKIIVAVSIIICIVIWWFYGRFNFV